MSLIVASPSPCGSPINEKKWSRKKWNCGCSLTCSHTWVAGSARGEEEEREEEEEEEGSSSPTVIGMPEYRGVTVRGEENKEAVERIETGHVALCRREMKWGGGSSRRPKQDMCHRVEEEEQ